jgi:hypothetical protein
MQNADCVGFRQKTQRLGEAQLHLWR